MAQQRIVIADDESYLTQLLSEKLRQRGYAVFVAHDGAVGYELALSHLPELVISDLQMPVLDGLKMCVQLRAKRETAHIPVLMLTARGHILTPEDLKRANIRGVLPKPFSTRELFTKIDQILRTAAREQRKAG
jgi:DNA-binding response OmpR family regulator